MPTALFRLEKSAAVSARTRKATTQRSNTIKLRLTDEQGFLLQSQFNNSIEQFGQSVTRCRGTFRQQTLGRQTGQGINLQNAQIATGQRDHVCARIPATAQRLVTLYG